jgi:acid phosphatase family membrane protein YuiD
VITDILTSQVIVSVLVASIVCHVWKLFDLWARSGKFSLGYLVAAGGMPSSHSSFVCSLALSIGFVDGFLSTVFLLSLGLAIIVVRDAFGVRHDIDMLRNTVNGIIREKKLGVKQILKITGHTPVQVVVGSLIGIVVPLVLHLFVF